MFWVHKKIKIKTIYWSFSSKNEKLKKKIELKSGKKKVIMGSGLISSTQNTAQYNTIFNFLLQYYFSSPDIYYLLLIFNYFFLFILNHTCLMSSRILHFILLNFITSSSKLLHLHFAFLLVRLCLLPIPVRHCLFSSFEF